MPEKKPNARDRERTRARILKSAILEFANNGYGGARVDAIVERARVSKNLVYHYFQSKEVLFIEVMEVAYAQMRSRQNEMSLTGLGPTEGMRKLISETFWYFVQTPETIRLMNSENLHKAKHIRKSKRIPEMYPPLLSAIENLLRSGQSRGVFRADVDALNLYISISGLSYFYVSNIYTLSTAFAVDLKSTRYLRRRLKHIIDLILGYLRPEHQPKSRSK
jgi:TetR/AcrR family transcriptional regulator